MLRKLLSTTALALLTATASYAQSYTLTDITPAGTDAMATTMSLYNQFQAGGAVYADGDFSRPNAALWDSAFSNGFSPNPVNLHPAALLDLPVTNGAGRSIVTGTSGATQVGYGSGPNTFQQVIVLAWKGTADSVTVLPVPFGSRESQALGIGLFGPNGSQIVGFANTLQSVGGRGTVHTFSGPPHALLWDEATHAVIDLHNGAQGTIAVATFGNKQVGYGGSYPSTTFNSLLDQPKAMLWNGSASSFVWLHPTKGYQASEAVATDGIQQAGWAQVLGSGGRQTTIPATHAALWTNTAASFVDLNPAGMVNSFATGVAGGKQVGYGVDANNTAHALVWSGSTASVIDLNQYLPPGFAEAAATGIDSTGNISGYMTFGTQRHAVIWSPVR